MKAYRINKHKVTDIINRKKLEELLKEWTARMATLVIPAWMARYCDLLPGNFYWECQRQLLVHSGYFSFKKNIKSTIYNCGLIMYCTKDVHKLTQTRKSKKCSAMLYKLYWSGQYKASRKKHKILLNKNITLFSLWGNVRKYSGHMCI